MKRQVLFRDGDEFAVLNQSESAAESALREALKRHPEVIAVPELDLREVVVVGRQVPVPAGSSDLLMVDADGRVIIVETRLSHNPDLRRQVVAQAVDYGASLWRAAHTLNQFEAMVLRYWHSDLCGDERLRPVTSLRQGLEIVLRERCGDKWNYAAFEAALEKNLAGGKHVLLVVASGVMDELWRDLLRYVNVCLRIPLYGVEVDVFEAASRQLIVPRGVRYSAQGPASKPLSGGVERDAFLASCMPIAAAFFDRMLDEADARNMIVSWSRGFSVRMRLNQPVTIMYGLPPDEFQIYKNDWPVDESQADFRRRLYSVAPFEPSGDYTSIIRVNEKTLQQANAALAFMWQEVERMMEAVRHSS